MLKIPQSRIYLFREPTDMRKSFDGLSSLVGRHLPEVDLVGSLFVFMNKRKNQIKALYWDENGYSLWCKRLQKGCFLALRGESKTISRRELTLMLEGVVSQRINAAIKSPRKALI